MAMKHLLMFAVVWPLPSPPPRLRCEQQHQQLVSAMAVDACSWNGHADQQYSYPQDGLLDMLQATARSFKGPAEGPGMQLLWA